MGGTAGHHRASPSALTTSRYEGSCRNVPSPACGEGRERAHTHESLFTLSPPLSRKREREQTEFAARLQNQLTKKRPP